MFHWIRDRRRLLNRTRVPARSGVALRPRLGFESLENRTTPTVSTIGSHFHGDAIPGGDSLWFSSAAEVSGVPASGATIRITHATIAAPVFGTMSVPDATIHFDPTATSASASFDANGWTITAPVRIRGEVFLDGLALSLPNGLPHGTRNVVWSGDFTADTPGLTVKWQWSATAYSRFSSDPAALGVKPSDARTPLYRNGDDAGTPENFKRFAQGDGRGDRDSNDPWAESSTKRVRPEVSNPQPPLATGVLSGTVTSTFGPEAASLALYKLQSDGTWTQAGATTSDATTGAYSFGTLAAGTYRIVLTPSAPPNGYYLDGTVSQAGLLDGIPDTTATASGATIDGIVLGTGTAGTAYDFVDSYRLFG